jgi:hypothetical protein
LCPGQGGPGSLSVRNVYGKTFDSEQGMAISVKYGFPTVLGIREEISNKTEDGKFDGNRYRLNKYRIQKRTCWSC